MQILHLIIFCEILHRNWMEIDGEIRRAFSSFVGTRNALKEVMPVHNTHIPEIVTSFLVNECVLIMNENHIEILKEFDFQYPLMGLYATVKNNLWTPLLFQISRFK